MVSGTHGKAAGRRRRTAKVVACWLCGLAAAGVVLLGLARSPAGAEPLKLGGPTTAAKPTPVDPATAQARAKLIAGAIQALTKEYQAYQKDPKSAKIREKSDYFKQNPSPEATPDAVMRGLEQTVSGSADLQAYVKWQLLSGIPGAFPPELNKRGVAAYKRAPAPFEHPGLARKSLSGATSRAKKEDIGEINKEFEAAVGRVMERNKIILDYRDELFSRLAKDADSMYAALGDVAQRTGAGLNANKFFDNVSAGIRSWALLGGSASATRGMADQIAGLKDAVGQDNNKPFTKFEDVKGKLGWKAEGTLDPKKLEEVIKFLDQTASNGKAGGLQFKK